jgi:hypothetical protein
MQATRLWRLACLLVLGSATLASCGKDEGTSHSVTPQGGASGASAGTPPTSTAGEPSGPVGGNSGVSGGSTAGSSTGGSTTNVGGAAGAGAQAPTGMGGDAGSGALGNGGDGGSGATTPTGEQLGLCILIDNEVPHADAQARAFAKAVFADCRIRWVVPLGSNLDEYRQQLVIWDLQFWGCQGAPVNDFGLVWGTPALSVGDANLLIEHYLTTVDAELQLSTDQRIEMKAALDRLAEQLISSSSEEPSQSSCVDNTGGAGGAAGAAGAP